MSFTLTPLHSTVVPLLFYVSNTMVQQTLDKRYYLRNDLLTLLGQLFPHEVYFNLTVSIWLRSTARSAKIRS